MLIWGSPEARPVIIILNQSVIGRCEFRCLVRILFFLYRRPSIGLSFSEDHILVFSEADQVAAACLMHHDLALVLDMRLLSQNAFANLIVDRQGLIKESTWLNQVHLHRKWINWALTLFVTVCPYLATAALNYLLANVQASLHEFDLLIITILDAIGIMEVISFASVSDLDLQSLALEVICR